jgi:2-amino-4-hydroxy-6-hydroxymethyldihydropteridine diphosphokinase
MLETVYLSLGSNIDNREIYLLNALHEISAYKDTTVVSVSSLYETEPVGMKKGNNTRDFLNMCCALKTTLDPFKMLEMVQKTGQKLGRRATRGKPSYKSPKFIYAPRTIDIDILLYGERILYTKALVVPHPLFHERRFVLEPLSEIAGNTVHPLFRLTVNELKYSLHDKSSVRYYNKITGAKLWQLKS